MNTDVAHSEIRELDHRAGGGFDVRLLWDSRTEGVFVAVEDARTGDEFRLAVAPPDALDAFHHPYAYSQTRFQGWVVEPDSA